MELESFAFVLLRRGPNASDFSRVEVEQLQAAHLAYLDELTQAGKLAGAGPFSGQADESLRGLCFYRCGLDEARERAELDPSVRAGRMAADVMTWWTRAGSVSFHRG